MHAPWFNRHVDLLDLQVLLLPTRIAQRDPTIEWQKNRGQSLHALGADYTSPKTHLP